LITQVNAGQKGDTQARIVPVSLVVLTKNEERNLRSCLGSLAGLCSQMLIVDSGSTDATLEIANQFGATVVHHPFESHTRQWNWALKNLPFTCEWTLCLDADQQLTPELRDEIVSLFSGTKAISENGFYLRRRQIFRGKWIRHGGYYPKNLLKLFRHEAARCDENERLDSRFYVKGQVGNLKHDLIEDNQNEHNMTFWIEKHNRYAIAQALEELERREGRLPWAIEPRFFGTPDQRTLFLRNFWYRSLPLYVRPFLLFAYRYFFRLGFMDGKQGFIFHFNQSLWFRLLVDAKVEELSQDGLDVRRSNASCGEDSAKIKER
jgi:glycosyltransferase involved in cell wall biosynthesis